MYKNDNLIKVSFTGDIMCEMPLLKASHIKDDEYNFNDVFKEMKPVFEQSDYVVGNLETICTGEEFGYTNHVFSFNTPEQFIESIKDSGIDMVTTATNHSLDRGVEGLKENLSNLNKYKLENTGTYLTKEDSEKIFYKEIEGMKIAFLNYTYGTNTHINGEILNNDELFHVGLLKSQKNEIEQYKLKQDPETVKGKLAKLFFKFISLERWFKIKKVLYKTHNKAFQDNDLSYIDEEYLESIKTDIEKAKNNADFTIVCMHSGGQFHPEPGKFSQYMMDFMDENEVDAVIGNHSHVVQKAEKFSNGMLGAYSLGNFSISQSSSYVIHEDLPEYSVMPHFYFDKKTKDIKKVTFSILKIIEDKNGSLIVYPIDKLVNNVDKKTKEEINYNATVIYNRFMSDNKNHLQIEQEYLIF